MSRAPAGKAAEESATANVLIISAAVFIRILLIESLCIHPPENLSETRF
jgi:hypothetical protein